MSRDLNAVLAAIERWTSTSVIDEGTAARLRTETHAHHEQRSSRTSQYVLAITGSVVLLIAGGVFVSWAWPRMDRLGRVLVLLIGGIVASAAGIYIEPRHRWRPTSYGLQVAGVGLLFSAFAYSETLWPDESLADTVIGLLALATPIVLAPRAMRRDPIMPAVHLAFGLGFFALFLDRTLHLSGDGIIWTTDLVLLGGVLTLAHMLKNDPAGEDHPWVLNAFVTAMGAGFLLVAATADGPLSMGDSSWLAVNAWWALAVALTVWGLERDTPIQERIGLERFLSLEVLGWIVLGLFTTYVTLDAGAGTATLLISGMGVLAFLYADRRGFDSVMMTAAVAFVLPIWIWAVDAAGALGGIAALVLTAVLLFWAAGRRGSAETS